MLIPTWFLKSELGASGGEQTQVQTPIQLEEGQFSTYSNPCRGSLALDKFSSVRIRPGLRPKWVRVRFLVETLLDSPFARLGGFRPKTVRVRKKNCSSGIYFQPVRIPPSAPLIHWRPIPTILREGGSRRVIALSWLRSRKPIALAPACLFQATIHRKFERCPGVLHIRLTWKRIVRATLLEIDTLNGNARCKRQFELGLSKALQAERLEHPPG